MRRLTAASLLHRRCNAGVATLQLREAPCSLPIKCYNHRKALGLKHAFEAEPFMTRHFAETLKHAGTLFEASDKKHTFLEEVNEVCDTNAVALTRTSFTRWDSFDSNVTKLAKTPQVYAAQVKAFERAGLGGAQDDFLMDAGAADLSAHGVAGLLRRIEYIAVSTGLLDWLPELRRAAKRLELWDLNHGNARSAVEAILAFLKEIADDYDSKAVRGSKWREFVRDVKAAGVDVKSTPGRSPAWIDRLLRRLANGLFESHREMLEDMEQMTAITALFNPNDPALPDLKTHPNEAELDAHFDDAIEVVVEQFCSVPASSTVTPALSEDSLRREFRVFRVPYLKGALVFQRKRLPVIRRAEKARVDDHNKKQKNECVLSPAAPPPHLHFRLLPQCALKHAVPLPSSPPTRSRAGLRLAQVDQDYVHRADRGATQGVADLGVERRDARHGELHLGAVPHVVLARRDHVSGTGGVGVQ